MFNNSVLDVFTGLIFIFLLFSLLATILQEILARWLNLRARMLQKALRRMLDDEKTDVTNYSVKEFFSEIATQAGRFIRPIKKSTLLYRFYSHPTIKYLGEDKIFSKPSYLHAHNFSQTLLHLLRGEEYDGLSKKESEVVWDSISNNKLEINDDTVKNLRHLFVDARHDTYLFRNKLEDWFEETMERASGWYKKQTQTILMISGFVIAVAFNVDTIAISKILMKDKKAREQMVNLAISRQQALGSITDSLRKIPVTSMQIVNGDTVITKYDSIPPRSDAYLDSVYSELSTDAAEIMGILGLRGIDKKKTRTSGYQQNGFLALAGWILTALAISLGAPFWFDLLNKFIKLRESGPKPPNAALQDKPGAAALVSNPIKGKDGQEILG